MSIEAMKQALDNFDKLPYFEAVKQLRTALRQAIEQAEEQEPDLPPVGIGVDVTAQGATVVGFYRRPNSVSEMFYSEFHPSPPRKPWVGLTVDEIVELSESEENTGDVWMALNVQAKLKEKNGGS